jgi:hypothetical protein
MDKKIGLFESPTGTVRFKIVSDGLLRGKQWVWYAPLWHGIWVIPLHNHNNLCLWKQEQREMMMISWACLVVLPSNQVDRFLEEREGVIFFTKSESTPRSVLLTSERFSSI